MSEPTIKITRTGLQAFETTFRIDLDKQGHPQGQHVSFQSPGDTTNPNELWRLYWRIGSDGRLYAGVLWYYAKVGAVMGKVSYKLRVVCSAIKATSTTDITSNGKFPPVISGSRVIYLHAYQGKGHGKQDIVVTFEVGYPEIPQSTSFSTGYTDISSSPIPNNIKFSFPQNLALYGHVDSLSKSTPYYKRLFESGFAEGAPSTPGPDSAKSKRRNVEREFEDSDDESDAYTVSQRTTNDPDGATTEYELPFRHVQIDHSAFTTYPAVLCYLQTGHIVFAPLRSSFRLQPNSNSLRVAEIKKLATDPAHPLAASPKSVYRLAHYLELTPLADLALANFKSQLTKENIAFEVFGDVAAVYKEVDKVTMEVALQDWEYVVSSPAMKAVEKTVEGGGMNSYSLQSLKLMRKMIPKPVADWSVPLLFLLPIDSADSINVGRFVFLERIVPFERRRASGSRESPTESGNAVCIVTKMSEVQRKQEADLTKECEEIIPSAKSLATSGKLPEALEKLAALEKQTRNAADLASTSKVLIATISILYELKEYDQLNLQLAALAKKHGQLRQATQKMVDEAMTYLPHLQGDIKFKLIETLREVTEGKIYLEVPRARVTRMLSEIREKEGNLVLASELLQELQVETFGSMERREKVDFVLEQMRLLKVLEDWDKVAIVAKRINLKWLAEKDHEDLKLRYYALMILWGLQSSKYLQVCKFYRQVYDTPTIQEDEAKWMPVLRNIVFFVVLAPYDNEQSDLLERVSTDDKLGKIAESFNLIKCFTTPELMRWPGIESLYGDSLRKTKVFGSGSAMGIDGDIEEVISKGEARWDDLHNRVVEHNIRTTAKYYTRITIPRLSQLLDLTPAKTEEFLSQLVTSKTVYAKIDRPAGIVSFQAPKGGDKVMNEWNSDVGKLMGLIEKSCHLIAKEHAVHAAITAKSLTT